MNQWEILGNLERFNCVTAGRRFGKTILAAYLALKHLCVANQTIWVVAPTYDLAKRTWKYIYSWVLQKFPYMKPNLANLSIYNPKAQSTLELKTAENPASVIGAGLNFLIVDEASRVKTSVWETALYPTLADKKGSAFLISTPRGRNWFYEMYLKGKGGDYPNYASFTFETKDNLSLPHLVQEQQEAEKHLPQQAYQQEYLAKFIDDAGQVFRNIRQCINGELREYDPTHSYVMGADLAKYEDYTVLTVLDLTDFHVVAYERFNKIDWEFQRTRIKTLADKYKSPIIIDATGVGDPIAESLERDGYLVHQYKYTNASKKFLIENLALKIERVEITFPKIETLIDELESFGYEYTLGGNIVYNAPSGYHDDAVNSLALAVYGAGHYLHADNPLKPNYPQGSMGHLMEQEILKKEQQELGHFI